MASGSSPAPGADARTRDWGWECCLAVEDEEGVVATGVSQALASGPKPWMKRGSRESMELLFDNVIPTGFFIFHPAV